MKINVRLNFAITNVNTTKKLPCNNNYYRAKMSDCFNCLSSDDENVLENTNGVVSLNMTEGVNRYTIFPKHPIHAVFTVGFAW